MLNHIATASLFLQLLITAYFRVLSIFLLIYNFALFPDKQIKEMQKPAVREFLDYVSRPEWGVDLSKKVTSKEPQASFRKLNVD